MSTQPAVKTRLIDTIGDFELRETCDGQRWLVFVLAGTHVPLGSAWGPAADNDNWFAWRAGSAPIRVESRDKAIEYITSAADAA